MSCRTARKWLWCAVIVGVTTVWLLTPAAAQKTTKIRFGLIPIAAMVTIFAAEKLGYYKENGLTVERQISPSTHLNATKMYGGALEMAIGNSVDILQTLAKGLDFVILSDHERAKAAPPDSGALFVLADSGIKSAKDLAGKRVTTTSLNNIATLVNNVVFEHNGVPLKSIKWMEVPFPNMIPTLLSKQVDAVFLVDPFTTILRQNKKAKIIAWPYIETKPFFPIAQIFASRKWVEANKDATKKFIASVHRAIDFVSKPANRAKTNEFILGFTRMTPKLVSKIPLIGWNAKLNVADLQFVADLMVKQGIMTSPINVDKFVYETAR